MVTLCSIKGPLNHLWFLDYLLYVGPFTFWPYYKTINIYFMVLYNEHWTFHCFTFTPKVFYDDFLFILPTLYKIKFFFSCNIIKWSITSCSWMPFPCIFFIFLLVTSGYSDFYFNVTGLPGSSTVTMQAFAYFLCMLVLFCPTRPFLREWASSLFLL